MFLFYISINFMIKSMTTMCNCAWNASTDISNSLCEYFVTTAQVREYKDEKLAVFILTG